jgi:LTXXQ motif family protein/Recombinase
VRQQQPGYRVPVEQFSDAIQLNEKQSAALDDLANASRLAAENIRNSCPKDVALTAPSRLAAMQDRVEAMRIAISIMKPALDKFYGVLSDEQKAKITALAVDQQPAPREDRPDCNAEQPGATEWPSEQIENNVKPTDAQRASLTALQDAAAKAADVLKSSCPPAEAHTPPARLVAVGARLERGKKTYGEQVINVSAKTGKLAAKALRERTDARAADLAPIIKELKAAGKTSLRAIAAGLNEAGIPTARGGEWSSPQVMRILERLDPFRSEEEAAAA